MNLNARVNINYGRWIDGQTEKRMPISYLAKAGATNMIICYKTLPLTLLHSERSKLHRVLAILSAIGLTNTLIFPIFMASLSNSGELT